MNGRLKIEVEELPFAWARREQAYAALDGELGAKLLPILDQKGIKGLAWYENGYRQFTNNVRPIRKPEDVKGLKIRSAELKMRVATFKLLGANPVTSLGFDPVHFGVIMALNLAIGGVTPPLGVCLMTTCRMLQVPYPPPMRELLPFIAAMVVALLLTIAFPPLVTWLASMS